MLITIHDVCIHSKGQLHVFIYLRLYFTVLQYGLGNGMNLAPPSCQFWYHMSELHSYVHMFSPLLVFFHFSEDLVRPLLVRRCVLSACTDWLTTNVSHKSPFHNILISLPPPPPPPPILPFPFFSLFFLYLIV